MNLSIFYNERKYYIKKRLHHNDESVSFLFTDYFFSSSAIVFMLDTSPAMPWISLGMIIFVALPSAAFANASSDLRVITLSLGDALLSFTILFKIKLVWSIRKKKIKY